MLERFEFEQLGSYDEFERLCADLLEAEGGLNVRGLGKGNDQGSDFLVDIVDESALGTRLTTYMIQCKWLKGGATVGQAAISEALTSVPVHQASGLLFLTSGEYSGTAMTKLNAFNGGRENSRAAVAWDGHDISKRLWRHPAIADRYFGHRLRPTARLAPPPSLATKIPPRFATVDLRGFIESCSDARIALAIEEAVQKARDEIVAVVLLTGAVGSGKTGVACGMARELGFTSPDDVAFAAPYDYTRALYRCQFQRDRRFVAALGELKKAPCLIVDDFGEGLGTETEYRGFAWSCLRAVVEDRRRAGRLTILPVSSKQLGAEVLGYVRELAAEEFKLDLGDTDLRSMSAEDSTGASGSVYLGREWLLEKLEALEDIFEDAARVAGSPNEVHEGLQRRLESTSGVPGETKMDELRRVLDSGASRSKDYAQFIESLPFESIRFLPDGSVKLHT